MFNMSCHVHIISSKCEYYKIGTIDGVKYLKSWSLNASPHLIVIIALTMKHKNILKYLIPLTSFFCGKFCIVVKSKNDLQQAQRVFFLI